MFVNNVAQPTVLSFADLNAAVVAAEAFAVAQDAAIYTAATTAASFTPSGGTLSITGGLTVSGTVTFNGASFLMQATAADFIIRTAGNLGFEVNLTTFSVYLPGVEGNQTTLAVTYVLPTSVFSDTDAGFGNSTNGFLFGQGRRQSTGALSTATYGKNASTGYHAIFQSNLSGNITTFAAQEILNDVNTLSTGTVATLAIVSTTNSMGVGGKTFLIDAGTSTTDYFSGYSSFFRLAVNGELYVHIRGSAPTDANINTNEYVAYLNEGGNALTFRVRYSGGSYKTGTVALS